MRPVRATRRRNGVRRLFAIPVRLFAFIGLLAFLPAAAMLFFSTYEKQMLASLEHALVQQGRVFASALSGGERIDSQRVADIIAALNRRQEARIRVITPDGGLLGDTSAPSANTATAGTAAADAATASTETGRDVPPDTKRSIIESPLYQIASAPARAARKFLQPPVAAENAPEVYDAGEFLAGAEVQAALAGRYGAATRISGGQRSVTLYSAIPVLAVDGTVSGAVLVSQSTYRILQDLYQVRIEIFRIFLFSLAAAAAVSVFLSLSIARPLSILTREAIAMTADYPEIWHRELRAGTRSARGSRAGGDGRENNSRATGVTADDGAAGATFSQTGRSDEIGELARSYAELTLRLKRQLEVSQTFAADVSHEFRNPLSTIRSAAEILHEREPEPPPGESDGSVSFPQMILEETARLERMLAEVRELSVIDSEQATAGNAAAAFDAPAWFDEAIGTLEVRYGKERVRVPAPPTGGPVVARADSDRVFRALDNLVDNAMSFSPAERPVELSLDADGQFVRLAVRDYGPGIPENLRGQIFDRFFTVRARDEQSQHSGLGLAIARAICRSYGGDVEAENAEGGGAIFRMTLRRASE